MPNLAVVLVLVAACGSETREPDGDSASAQLEWKTVGSLGLEVAVPADSNIDDTTEDAGYPSATIYASPITLVKGAGGGRVRPSWELKPTFEEEKADLEKTTAHTFKKFLAQEKTADGWVFVFELETIRGHTLHAVSVRRTIGGEPWDCGSSGYAVEDRVKALEICRSLRSAE